MLRNNLLIALRNFKKRKVFTFINVLGLTVGMCVCLLILSYARYELSFDAFHEQADQIYRVSVDVYNGDNLQTRDAQCYPALGPMAVEEFPEIEQYAMARHIGRILLKHQEVAFNEDRAYFASPGWLEIFDWEFIAGNPAEALTKPDQVILTASTAEKYFGNEDPVGKQLTVVPGGGAVEMMVIGVIEDIPDNVHLGFDLLISWESGTKYLDWQLNNWNGNNEFMYLLANSTLDNDFEDKLNLSVQAKVGKKRQERLVIQPLKEIHLYSDKAFEAQANGNAMVVNVLLLVAGFVMLVAWVNYINLATAKSLERAREVGVRKVLGTTRTSLIIQFLSEAVILNFLALVLTLTLLQGIMPLFNSLTGLSLEFNVFQESDLLLQLIGLCLFGSLASGLYPAFVLSKYKALSVISGRMKDSKNGLFLRRGLVIFQFMITMTLLVGTFTIYRQVNFMRQQELGFDKERALVLRAPISAGEDEQISAKMNAFSASLENIPSIGQVAFSESMIGQGTTEMNSTTGLRSIDNSTGEHINFYMYRVDTAFLNTLGITLLAGRNFDQTLDAPAFAFDSNLNKGILINESARKALGFVSNEAAVDAGINLWGNTISVFGVIADYHHYSLKSSVDPLFLMFDKTLNSASYITLKVFDHQSDLASVINSVSSVYKEQFPEADMEYFFLDDSFDQQYRADQQFGLVFTTFAGITIIVALLGLFGLVLYEIQQRIKEIGIRKVLGATVGEIMRLFAGSFLRLISISIIISLPIAYMAMRSWLNGYAYRVDINIWLFLLPAVLLIAIALATILTQSVLAARKNPVDALRYE